VADLLIVAISGSEEPTRASLPFHIAVNGAVAAGTKVAVALAGDAAELVKPDVIANVLGLGLPPLRELLDKCLEADVRLYVCRGCAEARGVLPSMLTPNATFISAPELVKLTMEADRVLSF
jgi:predicted peroxiredoxin